MFIFITLLIQKVLHYKNFKLEPLPAYGAKPAKEYTDLAWGGLSHAPIYDKHFSNKPLEKLRVENRYRCESIGGTAGSGTPSQQTAIGKPCK